MKTRSATRSRRQIYRSRVKSSPCRYQTEKCRLKYGCKKLVREEENYIVKR